MTREIRGRFAGLLGGGLWALIHPLALMGVYLALFSLVLRVQVTVQETGTDRFALYFLSGILPWVLFSEAVNRSAGCLLANANLITKVVFPVELLPLSAVASSFAVNGVGLGLFLLYLAFCGYLHVSWVLLLLLIPMHLTLTLGLSAFLAAANVFVRDIGEGLGIALMIWFFATPIIYPLSLVPPEFSWVVQLNPMTTLVELYRDALLRHVLHPQALLQGAAVSLGVYAAGAWFFMRARNAFADVL